MNEPCDASTTRLEDSLSRCRVVRLKQHSHPPFGTFSRKREKVKIRQSLTRQQPAFENIAAELGAALEVQAAERGADMGLDRRLRDLGEIGDLLVGEAQCGELGDEQPVSLAGVGR
jgi:hypothetical protein